MRTFIAVPAPNEVQKAAVRALEAQCNQADGTCLEIFLSNQFNAHPEMDAFFFCEEDGALVGVLSLYADNDKETEVTAVVRPDKRRQGVFSALLARAVGALAPYGPETVTFKTDIHCQAGPAVAARWNPRERSREFFMAAVPGKAAAPAGLEVGLAREEELEALAAISREAFGEEPEEAARYVRGTFEGADQLLFTGRLSGVPVGSTSVDIAGKTAYIYGVCIAAAHRGQGLGKSLLRGVLAALPAVTDKQPALSVEADNTAALGLYTGAGFSLVTEHRYYSAPFAAVRDSLG